MITPTLLAISSRAAAKLDQSWHDTTTIHPVGLASVVVLAAWHMLAKRQQAMLPLMILMCFIPSAQRIVIAGADFTLLRIMIIAGVARVMTTGALRRLTPNALDCLYTAWVVVGAAVYVVQQQSAGAIVYVCGTTLDMLGAYVVVRALVTNAAALTDVLRYAAIIGIVVSVFFMVELSTRKNLFAAFGGVRAETWVRDGRLRCQGAFSHPILAGVFWAVLGGMFVGAAKQQRGRWLFVAAIAASVLIIGATASSTPLLGFVAACGFWCARPARWLMRYVFIAAPFVLAGLHLVMQAPVWHLVARATAVGGSTGYHRYMLIDGAIRHVNEWWLTGTRWTGHWGPDYLQLWDVANQYIFEGVRGGVWRFGLFCAVIATAGTYIARAQRRAQTEEQSWLMWGLAAGLFTHCVCFIGVSYFGQIQYLWYMTIAFAAATRQRAFLQ